MAKTIVQKVVFKNTSPKALYDLYMDAKQHSKVTGGPAKITKKEGAAYSVHGGYITGKNLQLVENEHIVQTWRAVDWAKSDPDSIFIINLEQKGKDTILHAIHNNVPDKAVKGIDKGWHDHYWKPWKQHLAGKKITIPKM
ncbi:MAG: SRPBCC domain-containing protein [Bacteroidia bacterium]